jgi:hypothetical protein
MEEEGWTVVTYKKKVGEPKEWKEVAVKTYEREMSDDRFPEPKHYKCKTYEYE